MTNNGQQKRHRYIGRPKFTEFTDVRKVCVCVMWCDVMRGYLQDGSRLQLVLHVVTLLPQSCQLCLHVVIPLPHLLDFPCKPVPCAPFGHQLILLFAQLEDLLSLHAALTLCSHPSSNDSRNNNVVTIIEHNKNYNNK